MPEAEAGSHARGWERRFQPGFQPLFLLFRSCSPLATGSAVCEPTSLVQTRPPPLCRDCAGLRPDRDGPGAVSGPSPRLPAVCALPGTRGGPRESSSPRSTFPIHVSYSRIRGRQAREARDLAVDGSVFDITIIGGGPTGLFGAFYTGMRQMSTRIVDGLPDLGGQLTALYPEKFIYDMPGFPRVLAKDLVAAQVEQGLQYGAEVVLGEKVVSLERRPDAVWRLSTDQGSQLLSRTVLVTAGAGSFTPKTLPAPGIAEFHGRGVHYYVKNLEPFRDRDVLIVGGGDSAVDWALALEPLARQVTLIHRRDRFRAHEGSVSQLLSTRVDVCLFWEIRALQGSDRVESALLFENRSGEERTLPVSDVVLALGFHADVGPVKNWGLELDGNTIRVNSRMETNLPGVYAAGDVVSYDGKLKLIATGVAEAAIAV
ncbi:MAG: NAD(P)/FAD-dependent oxidoreductase, partial [Armatimonadetes bacterium]|nr:NAD(P)/FAD-dependent oxidoreductase [Armatimonadota bacterium]